MRSNKAVCSNIFIPTEAFIGAQDIEMRAIIFMRLEFLQDKGLALREPYAKLLGRGIFEIGVKRD